MNKAIALKPQVDLISAFLGTGSPPARQDIIVSDGTGYSAVARGAWAMTREINGETPIDILRLFRDHGENEPTPSGMVPDHATQRGMHMHVNWRQLHHAAVEISDEGNVVARLLTKGGHPVLYAYNLLESGASGSWDEKQMSMLRHIACTPLRQSRLGGDYISAPQRNFFERFFALRPDSTVLFTAPSYRLTQITTPRTHVAWRVTEEIIGNRAVNLFRADGSNAAQQNNQPNFTGGHANHQSMHSIHAHVSWADLGKAELTPKGGPNGNETVLEFAKKPCLFAPTHPALALYATNGIVGDELIRVQELVMAYNATFNRSH